MRHTFNYRSFASAPVAGNPRVPVATAADLADMAANAADYDSVVFDAAGSTGIAGYKRKSAEIELPDISLDNLTDQSRSYVLAMLYAAQAKAAKPAVDARASINPDLYTLDALAAAWNAAQASRPRTASIPTLDDAVLAKGQVALSAFWQAVAPKFAPRVSELAIKAFSYRAIERALGEITETRARNLAQRLDQFAEVISADVTLSDSDRSDLTQVAQLGQLMAGRFLARFAELASDDEM